jgi:hypothetical protein
MWFSGTCNKKIWITYLTLNLKSKRQIHTRLLCYQTALYTWFSGTCNQKIWITNLTLNLKSKRQIHKRLLCYQTALYTWTPTYAPHARCVLFHTCSRSLLVARVCASQKGRFCPRSPGYKLSKNTVLGRGQIECWKNEIGKEEENVWMGKGWKGCKGWNGVRGGGENEGLTDSSVKRAYEWD